MFYAAKLFLLTFIYIAEGQTIRDSATCSVPRCENSVNRTVNGSCSTQPQPCYSYTIPSVNQTFCAPSVSCSFFEPCMNGIGCSSNTSVCISSSCCEVPICLPIILGVTACNSTPPTLLPRECYVHTVNTDRTRNAAYNSSTSYCDSTTFTSGTWVRFSGEAGTKLATGSVGYSRCGSSYQGSVTTSHPTRVGESVDGNICFNYYSSCYYQSTIKITNCGSYFVYNLPPAPTCNLRYCTT